ncbi:hypothetical protein HGRIS_009716 [Hohenbuehelia grisea]|uniref:Zona occludens toxin N-terminal domain-containing protein n=1 Tax=Hohenbuehelia grisea TaxID=104357 RepID=A0ABR3J2F4_9AGAR
MLSRNTAEVEHASNELELLHDSEGDLSSNSETHDLTTAPLFTREAFVETTGLDKETQYGVMGATVSIHSPTSVQIPDDRRLYLNTNAPFSAIVCGVQGSGKSHTVSVMLESMFIRHSPLGCLNQPLSGLILHFGEGGDCARPCEAAWTGVSKAAGVSAPPVKVYVSKSSLKTMRNVYQALGSNVSVEPLLFDEEDLDAQAFLSMMAVGSSEGAPLYMQLVMEILRGLGEDFTYRAFEVKIEDLKTTLNPMQKASLEQRMALLISFMRPRPKGYGAKRPLRAASRFAAGQLTIIDLSDPFIDPASACSLFDIILRLFVRADVGTGKVVVVDEAHKYLSSNRGSSGLTKSLLTLIREQRHLSMRVIISTQEPTVVPPVLLDLCSVQILHRFSSPAWWDHLSGHVSADFSGSDAFDKVVRLKTGQAILLAPAALGMFPPSWTSSPSDKLMLDQLGRRYIILKTRRRVTADGGASVLVLDT